MSFSLDVKCKATLYIMCIQFFAEGVGHDHVIEILIAANTLFTNKNHRECRHACLDLECSNVLWAWDLLSIRDAHTLQI